MFARDKSRRIRQQLAKERTEAPDELKICLRCGRKSGFTQDESGDWKSECCGWEAVDPSAVPDSTGTP